MKVIDQARLWFREGSSDKVYDVDLVEVAIGQYVVNFRFGRRGTALKDGTKTAVPVDEKKARAIFTALVKEKTDKGYRSTITTSPPSASPTPTPTPKPTPPTTSGDPRAQRVLQRLWQGHRGEGGLLTVIRRAGDMDLRDAEPILLELLDAGARGVTADAWRHVIATALGRVGSGAAVERLERLRADPKAGPHVRAQAALAIATIDGPGDRALALARTMLPTTIAGDPYRGDPQDLARAVLDAVKRPNTARDAVVGLYIANDRRAVLDVARALRLDNHEFGLVRTLFHGAEMRHDAELYALLARRIEDCTNAVRPCGPATRAYFARRVARTLRRLGQIGSPDFVDMASAILLSYSDDDAREPVRGRWLGVWPRFGPYWALNYLVHDRSKRVMRAHHTRATWHSVLGETDPLPATAREEAFPALWDAAPDALWLVVQRARASIVAGMATLALRANRRFVDDLTDDALAAVLATGHPLSQRFAFDAVRSRPITTALVRAALASVVDEAHTWVLGWVGANPAAAVGDADIVAALITSRTPAVRDAALRAMQLHPPADAIGRSAAARAIAIALGFDDSPASAERASAVAAILLRALAAPLRSLGVTILRDLVAHPLAALGELAGEIALAHDRGDELPADLIEAMLSSPHSTVRAIGGRLLARTPPEIAKDDPEALIVFALSANAELRAATRSLVGAVASAYPDVGRAIATRLVDALLARQAEGAPAHVVSLLRNELAATLPRLDAAAILRLIGALSPHAREAGGLLLPQVVADEIGLDDVVRLANHEVLAIRQGAWSLAAASTARWKLAPAALAKLCDSKWQDTRDFAFAFVRESFGAQLGPDTIVAICDSLQPQVQDFGKALLVEQFRPEHAGRYLVRLAEHPSSNLQLLASTLLDGHARGNLDMLAALAPYLVTVLSQVNRGGVAKQRVLAFLRREATSSPDAARIIAPILDRQSATIAVTHKQPLIATMVDVAEAFPDVPLPIEIVNAEDGGR